MNNRVLLQSRIVRSGLTYTVDVCRDRSDRRVVVVHRDGTALAVGRAACGEWAACGGKPAIWAAAVAAIPSPSEVAA
jgi:hypothetical protein